MNKIIKLARLHYDSNGEVINRTDMLLNVDSMITAQINPELCSTSITYREESVKTIECLENIETIMYLINQKNY
jgi:hypothetical protein